ncbi:MAG TPA: DNA ligase D [Myxococcota bacterium]|nr:DNA ligase D [Myxococcota bacterium]
MADLRRYREKRDPNATPEPFGGDEDARALPANAARAFVVQQHAARSMHWDFRIEIEGALVSFAIPKGPTLDPREKRFAAQTEDHPLEYADFEGVIPAGNYGAGAMIVWDRGSYHTVEGRSPKEGLAAGKLDLLLRGHKLRGRFGLVRMKGEGGKSWLWLSKWKGRVPEPELVVAEPGSVLSGLSVAELREGVTHTARVEALALAAGAPARALPGSAFEPMLAESAEAAFTRDGWLFELKYDGARVLALKGKNGSVRLLARSGRDATETYPEIARAVRHLPVSECAIDGEVVALDERGRASFELLQTRFRGEARPRAELDTPVVYYAFDAPSAAGYDLRALPLSARKEILAELVPRNGFVRFSDHVAGAGEALLEVARANLLEGIVAKRADSRYESGRRSKSWLKIKLPRTAFLAVVGYQEGKGAREKLGSLLLAWRLDGKLVYAGSAGSGLDDATIAELRSELDARRSPTPAFDNPPALRGLVFVPPELVCEVRYTEVTSAGMMRHPVFVGLRPDVALERCVAPVELGAQSADAAPPAPSAARTLEPEAPRLTRLDKVFWPVEGYTKGDLLAYYEAVWPWLAPYLRDRPLVLTRYPDGIEGKSFYQKNAPDFTPDWVLRQQIEGTDFFVCNELRTLLYVINSGAIPLHVWSARSDALDRPDWLILDLDPKQAPFAHVVEIARHIHALLDELGATHFAKTSGQDGLHVLVPLGRALDHDDARRLAEVLARAVCAALPEIATITRPVAARGDKVYVDYLQNGRGKLIASPFSVRPRPGAPVSMPLEWKQVNARLDPAKFTIKTAIPRLAKGGDPLAGVLGPGVDAVALLGALAQRLA